MFFIGKTGLEEGNRTRDPAQDAGLEKQKESDMLTPRSQELGRPVVKSPALGR